MVPRSLEHSDQDNTVLNLRESCESMVMDDKIRVSLITAKSNNVSNNISNTTSPGQLGRLASQSRRLLQL